jgi:hypothetical protein
MARHQFDPLTFVPSPDVIREKLRETLTLAERLRLLLDLAERLRLPVVMPDNLAISGDRKVVRDVA